jgi:membrane-associated PAP2 superfamily phosphatase
MDATRDLLFKPRPASTASSVALGRAARTTRRIVRRGIVGVSTRPCLREPVAIGLWASLLLTAVFLALPGIDLAVSEAFYSAGSGFWLSENPVLRALRKSSSYVMGAVLVAALATLVCASRSRGHQAAVLGRKGWFLLLGFALGPGLLVNGVLKSLWGRPRPIHIQPFGGDVGYEPVWRISEACASNCSFVSGESSSAAWMVAVLVLVPARWRLAVGVPLTLYAVLLSLNRIAFGGHFLSDVLLSWSLTALVMGLTWRIVVATPAVARIRPRRPAMADTVVA